MMSTMQPYSLVNGEAMLQNLQAALDQAPQEFRDAAPTLVSNLTGLANTGVAALKTLPFVAILKHCEDSTKVMTAANATEVVKSTQHVSVIANNKEAICLALTSNTVAPKEITDGIRSSLSGMGNGMLACSLVFGVVQVAITSYSLWNIWQAIKDARNVGGQCPQKMQEIQNMLDRIPPMFGQLNEIIIKLRREGLTQREITFIHADFDGIHGAINDDLASILTEISDLECIIGVSHTKLSQCRKQIVTNGIGGASSGISGFVNVGLLAQFSNPVLLTITGIMAGINIVLAVACATRYFCSEKELELLANKLEEVKAFRRDIANWQRDLRTKRLEVLSEIRKATAALPE